MLKNFVRQDTKTVVRYSLVFTDGDGNGYSFPCDADGVVVDNLPPEAKENLKWCFEHPDEFEVYDEIERYEDRVVEHAHGTCTCGNEVYLYDEYYGACRCEKCGRWYNMFGQELLDPKYWEKDPADEEYYD